MATPQISTGSDLGAVASGIYGDAYKSAEKFDKETEAGIQKMESEKVPTPPVLKEAPKASDFQTDQMQTFGSAAMFLSAFGSLLTKHPLESALNSSAAVMNAYHKNDAESFNKAFDQWKVDNENSWKMANYNQELYKDVLGKDEAELKARAVSAKDNVMIHMADAKMAHQLYQDREKHITKGQGANQAIVDYVETKEEAAKTNGMSDEQIAMNRPKWFGEALSETKGKGEEDSELKKEKYEEFKKSASAKKDAESWNNGLPVSGFIRGRGKDADRYLQFVKDYAAELSPDSDRAKSVEDYNAANKAISAFGSGKQGDIVKSFNVAYNHADVVTDLAIALRNGDVQAINKAAQAYESQTGDPAPTNFDAAKGIFSDEINKAAVGGAGALADREAIRESISKATSEDQIMGALNTYKSLIAGQMQGMKQQYEQATKRKDFDRLLSPNVADDLKKRGDGLSKEKPMPLPKDNKFEIGKYYANDKGEVGKYIGEKDGHHVFE